MTVKQLIHDLLDLPLDSKVDICIKDTEYNLHFVPAFMVYDEENGKVIISGKEK